eukprot:TRINITY_DN6179_c0_g2_i1.p1 TRINITY_DN6179_c0_g2~~TRINITY_DN6179_c0_g2_i1.p1  ORF type:complete len:201 (+),score=29.71 TRINITY_DN6179_c0_g2_i1:358-960(+)
MFENLRAVVRTCATCQKTNPFARSCKDWHSHMPTRPGLELQMDHVGPFKDNQGDKFWIFNVSDRFTGKLFATTEESPQISDVLIFLHQVVFHTCVPTKIHADGAFRTNDFAAFCEKYGIKYSSGVMAQSHGHEEVMDLTHQATVTEGATLKFTTVLGKILSLRWKAVLSSQTCTSLHGQQARLHGQQVQLLHIPGQVQLH